MPARVAVVGGGVAGLTAAYRLTERTPDFDVVVVEAAARPGGKLDHVEVGDLTVPAGPDSFVARKPWAVDLCRELGLTMVSPSSSGAWLWTERGLVPYTTDAAFGIPGDVGDVFRWPGLTRAGRRRALVDLIKPKRKGGGDETLGGILRRRLGDEATDAAIAPLLAGLFAGDVDQLSVQATFPELARWEASQGSLIRGSQAARRVARRGDPGPLFLRPRGGVHELPDALAAKLGDRVRTSSSVRRIERVGEGWRLSTESGTAISADAVVLAVDAGRARRLMDPIARSAATDLDRIPSVSTAVVAMIYAAETARLLPDGTGFVVPRERAPMTACTWLSSKWPDPAYGTRAVVRCFVGAAGDEDVLDASDEDIVDACARHLSALLEVPDRPEHTAIVRWPSSMPQYLLGHVERVARIRENLPPSIFVTGQAYDGVGVADCVRSAGDVADAVASHLTSTTTQPDQQESRR